MTCSYDRGPKLGFFIDRLIYGIQHTLDQFKVRIDVDELFFRFFQSKFSFVIKYAEILNCTS